MKNLLEDFIKRTSELQKYVDFAKYSRAYFALVVIAVALVLVFQDSLFGVPAPVSLSDVAVQATELAISSRGIPAEKADSFLRLTGTYDNYNRCQNKLGVRYEGGIADEAASSASQKITKDAGGKFSLFSVDNPSQVGAAARYVLNARKHSLRAIIEFKGDRFALNPQAMIAFAQAVSTQTQDSTFIVTVSADYEAYQAAKAAGRVQSSGQALGEDAAAVAGGLRADTDIILASPVLEQFQLPTARCLEVSGGDEGVCFKLDSQDEWRLYNQMYYVYNYLDQDVFDVHLLSITNAELGFANLSATDPDFRDQTHDYLRASYAFEKYTQPELETFNEKYDSFRRAIIVDFGPQAETNDMPRELMQQRLMYDYGLLSDNPLVEGIVVGSALRQWFNDAGLSRLHLEGTNCNYDSVDYNFQSTDTRAAAAPSSTQTVNNAGKAKVRVVCSGRTAGSDSDGQCLAQVRFTLKVGLPVLHCGSNSIFGTDTRPFSPPAIRAAINYHLGLDYLNQFAGRLTTDDASPSEDYTINNYPLPWLGTCLSSHYPDYASTLPPQSEWALRTNLGNDGLSRLNYEREAGADKFTRKAFSALLTGYTEAADERYFVYGRDLVINKDNLSAADTNTFNLLDYAGNDYQPVDQPGVNSIVNDAQNYVYGSEILVEDKELFSKSANNLAYEEYVHRLRNGGSSLFTSRNVFEVKNTSPATGCGCALSGQPTPGTLFWSPYNIGRGCELTPEQIGGGQCIAYRSGEGSLDNYYDSDFEVEVSLPDFPEYKIDGAYDTLAALYNRVQTKLSLQGRKLIINSKRGWRADVSIKAYHLPAWFQPREIDGARRSQMLEDIQVRDDAQAGFNIALNNGPQSRVPALAGGTVAGAASDVNSCKSGVNFANGQVSPDDIAKAATFGYGYGQFLTLGTNAAGDASVMDAICSGNGDNAMIPVLRYCYDGGPCAFEGMDDSNAESKGKALGAYYRQVANLATSCRAKNLPMYFACGHNEPITEYVTHNGLNPISGMRTEGKFSKGCVDALQADGKTILATTSIFNATIADAPGTTYRPDGSVEIPGKYLSARRNVTNFIEGYGGTAAMQSDMSGKKLSCIALNTYSFGTNPDQLAGHYYNELMQSPSVPQGAKGCVMETGWIGQSSDEQTTNAEGVVENLLSTAADSLEFFLYYNATGTGGPNWERFKISDEKNEAIGKCAIDFIPGGGEKNPDRPTLMSQFDMHLAEGDNFARQYQYYEYLENINYLHFIDTVYLSDSSVNDTIARNVVGLPLCEELTGAARDKVDCLAPFAEQTSSRYTADPLGKFLCSRGYNVVSESCQRQCTTTVTPPAVPGGVDSNGNPITNAKSVEAYPAAFRNIADKIEANMCVPRGLLYALIERETPGSLPLMSGDPYQKLYERANYAGASGPAQFTDIAWSKETNPAYGKENGVGYLRNPYGTQYCLDAIGIDYDRPALWESASPRVLNRSVVAYALCGAAAKLKADSQTGPKCTNWSQEDIFRAAKAYLGACEQNGRSYCSSYVASMCALFPAENAEMCSNLGYDVKVQCTDGEPVNQCEDGLIRLINPLRENADRARVSQDYDAGNEHSGVDYAIVSGTPVYAAASGRVIKVWSQATGNAAGSEGEEAAGNFVKLEHARTGTTPYYTSYQHLSAVTVELGQEVKVGDKIGEVGNTGNSTGSHLHFELRVRDCYDGYGDGEPFGQCSTDPTKYIVSEEQMNSCEANPNQNPVTAGVCPVEFPGSASISQGSESTPVPDGARLGSHGTDFVKAQLPTDILTSGQKVISPISGVVEAVMNPRETLALYEDPELCSSVTTPSGEIYYDGGFAVYIREDGTDNLWRFVHLEIPTVQEGQAVKPGDQLGTIFDGLFTSNDVYDGVNWDEFDAKGDVIRGTCFRRSYQHLHFAIISANAAPKPPAGVTPEQVLQTYRGNRFYTGNTIDSVPWVKEACGY